MGFQYKVNLFLPYTEGKNVPMYHFERLHISLYVHVIQTSRKYVACTITVIITQIETLPYGFLFKNDWGNEILRIKNTKNTQNTGVKVNF